MGRKVRTIYDHSDWLESKKISSRRRRVFLDFPFYRTVRSDGAADGGSHDPSRVELPVVMTQGSISAKTSKAAVCEKSGFGRGDRGFRVVLEGRCGADDPPGDKLVPGRAQMDVYFQPLGGQKVNSCSSESEEVPNE